MANGVDSISGKIRVATPTPMSTDHTASPSQHIIGLDFLRFAAACLVLFYHFGSVSWSFDSPEARIANIEPFLSPLWPLAWVGFIGVPIFFVISGFVIAYSAERATAFQFARDRFLRLWPALFIAATISLFIFTLSGELPLAEAAKRYLRELVFHPFRPWLDLVVWTLAVEIAFYAAVFVLLAVKRFQWLPALAAIMTLTSVAYNFTMLAFDCAHNQGVGICPAHNSRPDRLADLFLLEHGAMFALGVFLWLWLVKGRRAGREWWAVIATLGACANIIFTAEQNRTAPWFDTSEYSAPPAYALAITIWALAVLALAISIVHNHAAQARLSARARSKARILGLSTYPLYLLHLTTGSALIGAVRALGAPPAIAIATGTALVIGLSIGVAAYVEPPIRHALRTAINRLPFASN